ncbi:unnamed protein product [Closterium sp. NIES-65]|nr:unnamed protein product [Closterium sp. NIES-65]
MAHAAVWLAPPHSPLTLPRTLPPFPLFPLSIVSPSSGGGRAHEPAGPVHAAIWFRPPPHPPLTLPRALPPKLSHLSPSCPLHQVGGVRASRRCQYMLQYGDGSTTAGDVLFDSLALHSTSNNSANATIAFGCGVHQTGRLASPSSTASLSGVMGLGRGPLSIVTQLAAQGVLHESFSLCLEGRQRGGHLVLGRRRLPVTNATVTAPLAPSDDLTVYRLPLLALYFNLKTPAPLPKASQGHPFSLPCSPSAPPPAHTVYRLPLLALYLNWAPIPLPNGTTAITVAPPPHGLSTPASGTSFLGGDGAAADMGGGGGAGDSGGGDGEGDGSGGTAGGSLPTGAVSGGAVIDSGSTFTALPAPIFSALTSAVTSHPSVFSSLEKAVNQSMRWSGFFRCLRTPKRMSSAELASTYPPLQLDFSANLLWAVPAYNYLFHKSLYYASVASGSLPSMLCRTHLLPSGGLLAGSWLRNNDVLFNHEKNTIGFVPMNCTSGKLINTTTSAIIRSSPAIFENPPDYSYESLQLHPHPIHSRFLALHFLSRSSIHAPPSMLLHPCSSIHAPPSTLLLPLAPPPPLSSFPPISLLSISQDHASFPHITLLSLTPPAVTLSEMPLIK